MREPAILPAAERHANEVRVAARQDTVSSLRFGMLSDKRDYTGIDPIKGTIRDEAKAGPGIYCSPRHPTHFRPSFRHIIGCIIPLKRELIVRWVTWRAISTWP